MISFVTLITVNYFIQEVTTPIQSGLNHVVVKMFLKTILRIPS